MTEEDPIADFARRGGARIFDLVTEAGRRAKAEAARAEKKRKQDDAREALRRKSQPKLEDLTDWTEELLADTSLPPLEWLVPDMMPAVGVWLFSAPPKIGKSFLMTSFCRSVATGTMLCGYKQPAKRPVIYLDLEGSVRRAQTRQKVIRGDWGSPSPDFHNYLKDKDRPQFPNMDQDGMVELEKAIELHGAKLVVVDVWNAFRPARKKGEDAYGYDYRTILPIVDLAHRLEIAIILVHHNRKQADADWMAEASGSTGLTGAVDGTMVINRQRGEDMAVLHLSGRDVDEQELAIKFSGGLWTILGDAREYFAGEHRKKVHGVLSLPQNAAGIAVKDLVEECEMKRTDVNRVLRKLRAEGTVTQPRRGWYALARSD